MTTIDVMKLALDALDVVKLHYTQNRHVNEAITAIKEALAQTEQEPVAHQYQSKDGVWRDFISQSHYKATVEDGSWPIRALYTFPPAQRKPLTDEQFNDLVMEHLGPHALTGGKMSVYDAFLKAVRATEAAHNIKEQPAPVAKPHEQEPVAYQDTADKCRLETVPAKGGLLSQRTWVSLTDEQVIKTFNAICNGKPFNVERILELHRAIEAKLKEKNCG